MMPSFQIMLDDIPIQIQRKKNIKRLSIKVHPHQGVILNTPFDCPEAMIEIFIESVNPWIKKHYKPLQSFYYTQGEKHLFLGVEYPLNLIHCNVQSDVIFDNHQLNVYSQKFDSKVIQERLYAFYQREASSLFPKRVQTCMQRTPWVKRMPQLKYRFMTSRYGSCSSQGNISLNIHLMKVGIELIDYVILHELCHIKEHHHGPQFYQLMDEVMPNWPQFKDELKQLRF